MVDSCRALGSSWQLPWEKTIQLSVFTRVQLELGILHGSGAATSNPGSTIQARNNKAPLRTLGHKHYWTKVVSNNGNTSIDGWSTTSIDGWSTTSNNTGRRQHNTKHSQHAPLQHTATNIHRRVWYLWRMEIQVSSIHGTNGLPITTATWELRKLNNNNQRSRPSSSSKHHRRSKQVDTTVHWLEIHPG